MAAKKKQTHEPTIENRRARHDYSIEDTLECGIRLVGSEIKSVRMGQVSLQEGYVRANDAPVELMLYGVHIGEYSPAGSARQHAPGRPRQLLAHKREITKLAVRTRAKGTTLIPLKLYFVRGRAKLLIGVATGKRRSDKRQDIASRDAKREMERAMARSRR